MALKFIIDNLESVEEAQRGLYKKLDSGKFQLDVDGAVDKSRLDEFRNNNVELQKQIDKYKDVDPAKYKELMAIQTKIQEKELLDKGEVDALVALRVKTMREELETQLNESNTKLNTANASLANLLIDNVVKTAALKAGIHPTAIDDVTLRARMVFQIENGVPVPKGADGKLIYDKTGDKPISVDYWLQDLKKVAPHLFVGAFGGGAGGGGGSGNVDVTKMTPLQKISFGMANGGTGTIKTP